MMDSEVALSQKSYRALTAGTSAYRGSILLQIVQQPNGLARCPKN